MGPEIGQPPGYLGNYDPNQDLDSDIFYIKPHLWAQRASVFHSSRKTQQKNDFFRIFNFGRFGDWFDDDDADDAAKFGPKSDSSESNEYDAPATITQRR